MKIAAEGYPFILVALGLSVLAFVLVGLSAELSRPGSPLFFISFFRDPERHPPEGKGLVVAPADGKVVSIVKTHKAPLVDGPKSG